MIAKLFRKIPALSCATINTCACLTSGRLKKLVLGRPALVASVVITALLLPVKQLNGFQPLELAAFDRMVQLQPDAGADPRLLVVAITEADIQALQQWPLSDHTISQVIEKIQQYQPRVVGLDLYRNIPQPPGNPALLQQLSAPNIITITKLDDVGEGGVPAPTGVPKQRVGFNDLVLDPDGAVRRNLMFATTPTEQFYSFSLRLSLKYLADQGISLKILPDSLQLGKTAFVPLESNAGGYQNIDARGYQVLLNYRGSHQAARQVTVTQVLQGKLQPEWVKDKVVLIGTTAPSAKDLFFTPYSVTEQENLKMPGVMVHAQMVSQILSAVTKERSLYWFLPQSGEVLWLWCWSFVGGMLAWRSRLLLYLGLGGGAALVGLGGIGYCLFIGGGWVPLVEPALALLVTGASVLVYKQTTLQIANQNLQRLARLDSLTQIANRREFDLHLATEWGRTARTTQPLSLILCDIDYFKPYNDTYGHPAGDACLRNVAQAISCLLKRPADLVARYGGEEFAIILPNTDTAGAAHLADAILQQVQQLMIPHSASAVSPYISVSVGVASTVSQKEFSSEALLAAADQALYEAKKQGRNRAKVKTLTSVASSVSA